MVAGSSPAGRAIGCTVKQPNYGGRSSVGRAQDCDSCGRGFDPHRPPHFSDSCTACRYPASIADVVELVDTPDLGSGAARCESSSLSVRTTLLPIIFPYRSENIKKPHYRQVAAFFVSFYGTDCQPRLPAPEQAHATKRARTCPPIAASPPDPDQAWPACHYLASSLSKAAAPLL